MFAPGIPRWCLIRIFQCVQSPRKCEVDSGVAELMIWRPMPQIPQDMLPLPLDSIRKFYIPRLPRSRKPKQRLDNYFQLRESEWPIATTRVEAREKRACLLVAAVLYGGKRVAVGGDKLLPGAFVGVDEV